MNAIFDAYIEWMIEDPGGDALAEAITSHPDYSAWLLARTKETIGEAMGG